MNGQHHYREAERLLSAISAPDADWAAPGQLTRAELLAAAQVHATLAAAAAAVQGGVQADGWEADPARDLGPR